MFRILSAALTMVVAGLLLCGSVQAQSAAGGNAPGIWMTNVNNMDFAFHIKKDGKGGLSGTVDILDQGNTGIPMASVAEKDSGLVLDMPAISSRFEGKWNAATKQWDGMFTIYGAVKKASLVRGTGEVPAVNLAGLGTDLGGTWEGSIKAPGGVYLPVAFIITAAANKTTAILEIHRDDGIRKARVSGAARTPQRVRIEIGGFDAVFEGALSADKKSIAGAWHQVGNALPLTVIRRAAP
jgi:hypothetical protein